MKKAKTTLSALAIFTFVILPIIALLFSCDPVKRHQKLVRKHPHVLALISKPTTDTVRIDNTREVVCPDGKIIQVNCDTVVIVETNTIQLPPTNAQIRQLERSKRNFEDNVRNMYKDSLEHVKEIFKLENKRLKDENRTLRDISDDTRRVAKSNSKGKRKGSGLFITVISIFGLFILGLFAYRLIKK